MGASVEYAWGKARTSLLKAFNKDFLIFLFFFVVSAFFWLMMTLNETYEREIAVPVRLVGVPQNVIITSGIRDTVVVTVRDKGYTLITYVTSHRVRPLYLKFENYANMASGEGTVPIPDIQKLVYQQLYGSSRIVGVKPDRLEFNFNYGQSKRVPVRIAGRVEPGSTYYLANTRFWPDHVIVYANNRILDSIRYVTTEDLEIVNFEDTVIRRVNLKKMQGVKMVPSTVKIGLYPDVLTEESVVVPIVALNMPPGKVLRTFPSKVKVNFVVGASMFRNIKPAYFKVVADFNELSAHPSDKCTIYLQTSPHNVSKARLETNQVDYLIEQQ